MLFYNRVDIRSVRTQSVPKGEKPAVRDMPYIPFESRRREGSSHPATPHFHLPMHWVALERRLESAPKVSLAPEARLSRRPSISWSISLVPGGEARMLLWLLSSVQNVESLRFSLRQPRRPFCYVVVRKHAPGIDCRTSQRLPSFTTSYDDLSRNARFLCVI